MLSAKLLDVAAHPDIAFASEQLQQTESGWTLTGGLTVHDVTQPVTLTVERSEVTDSELRIRATTRIDRYAFGVTRRPRAGQPLPRHLAGRRRHPLTPPHSRS